MPRKPLKPCRWPGCPELVEGAYCDKHRKQMNNEYNQYLRDEDSKKFYNSTAWRKLARKQLIREPLCSICLKEGRASMAEIADHIKPITEGGERLDINNLQSLCRSCHNKKHSSKQKLL